MYHGLINRNTVAVTIRAFRANVTYGCRIVAVYLDCGVSYLINDINTDVNDVEDDISKYASRVENTRSAFNHELYDNACVVNFCIKYIAY